MKKRQRNKIFKIVASRLQQGFEIHSLHQNFIHCAVAEYVSNLYETEFRSWWYEQDWSTHSLKVEASKFFEQAESRFGKWSGIDIDLWAQYWKSMRKVEDQV